MFVYIDRRKKFPVTTLLRALGYSTDSDLLKLFDLIEEVKVKDAAFGKSVGRISIADIIDMETGELLLEKEAELTEEAVAQIKQAGIKSVKFLKPDGFLGPEVITNTLKKDAARSEADALAAIYRHLRSGDAPDLDTARTLIERMFFNPKRCDLGQVGRYRVNKKLTLDIPIETTVLTREDIVEIIKYLLELRAGKRVPDDIDHLGNRRIKTVGEQLSSQMNLGLSRMARTIKERMNLRDNENLTP